jgi:hypothetical protein
MRTDEDTNMIGLTEFVVRYYDEDGNHIGDTEYHDEVNLTDFRNTAKDIGAASFVVEKIEVIFDEQV